MIKILKCTFLELNSKPLDRQSDALPVELSMPLHSIVINGKIRYFNCLFILLI